MYHWFPIILPEGYKMSFHLKLHEYPINKKTVITTTTILGEKGLICSEYLHSTLLMSFKRLLSFRRERKKMHKHSFKNATWLWLMLSGQKAIVHKARAAQLSFILGYIHFPSSCRQAAYAKPAPSIRMEGGGRETLMRLLRKVS